MTVAAKITPTELGAQVTNRFKDSYFVVKLLNAGGLSYTPGLQDPLQFVIDYELTPGEYGYLPQVFGYVEEDVTNYVDDGVGLLQKQVIFQHDNSATSYSFDNISVQWAGGVVLDATFSEVVVPATLTDGTYENLPVDSITGNGSGMTVTIDVFSESVVSLTVTNRGIGYTTNDDIQITAQTLLAAGAQDGAQGPQGVTILDVYSPENVDSVLCIAPTAALVTLAGGNETGIYLNYKNFGFYNTAT